MFEPLKAWNEIQHRAAPYSGSGTRHTTPAVIRPSCTKHCTGRHHREAVMRCPQCQTVGYELWAHEWLWTEGHYFYERLAVNGSPPYTHDREAQCPDCQAPLRRG